MIEELQVSGSSAAVSAALRQAVDLWGASWQEAAAGGFLRLPVVRGLRYGIAEGPLTLESQGKGTKIRFAIEKEEFRLNRSAVAILVVGAAGGLMSMLWPLHPSILRLAPAGIVLAIAAWLLVSSRLRNSDANDFLHLVAELAAHEAG